MADWQPIETAPDGDVLLLGWWFPITPGGSSMSWECDVEWYEIGGGHCATHWQPLPPPPESLT